MTEHITIRETQHGMFGAADRHRATCICGWEGDWRPNWQSADAAGRTHAQAGGTKNSIQEGVDEAAEQGQTSDTQRNTR